MLTADVSCAIVALRLVHLAMLGVRAQDDNFRKEAASFTIYFYMGSIRLIATAFAIFLALCVAATSAPAQSNDAAKISNDTATEDQAFAGYERVAAGITPPKAIHSPDPQYPDVPADTEPRGVVVMLIGVNSHGHVGPVRVVRSSAPVFEKSAVSTVKTWRFKPAKKDGKPVPVQITVEMSFAK